MAAGGWLLAAGGWLLATGCWLFLLTATAYYHCLLSSVFLLSYAEAGSALSLLPSVFFLSTAAAASVLSLLPSAFLFSAIKEKQELFIHHHSSYTFHRDES